MIKKKGTFVFFVLIIIISAITINILFIWFQFDSFQRKSIYFQNTFEERIIALINESDSLKKMLTYLELNQYRDETLSNPLLVGNKDYAKFFMVVDDQYILTGEDSLPRGTLEKIKQMKWYNAIKTGDSLKIYSDQSDDVRNDKLLIAQPFHNISSEVDGVLFIEVNLNQLMNEISLGTSINLSNMLIYNDKGNIVYYYSLMNESKSRYTGLFQNYKAIKGPFKNMNGYIASYEGHKQILFEQTFEGEGLHLVYKEICFRFQLSLIVFSVLEWGVVILLIRKLNETYKICQHYNTVKSLLDIEDEYFQDQVLEKYNHKMAMDSRMEGFFNTDLSLILELLQMDQEGYSEKYIQCAQYLFSVLNDKVNAMQEASVQESAYAFSKLDAMSLSKVEQLMNGYLTRISYKNQKRIDFKIINDLEEEVVTYIGDYILLSLDLIDDVSKEYDYLTVEIESNSQALYLRIKSKHYFDQRVLEQSSAPQIIHTFFKGDLHVESQEIWLQWPLFNHNNDLLVNSESHQYCQIKIWGYHLSESNHFILKGYAEKMGFNYEKITSFDKVTIRENDVILFNMPASKDLYQSDHTLISHRNKIVIIDAYQNDNSSAISYLNCIGWVDKPLTQSKIIRLLENMIQNIDL